MATLHISEYSQPDSKNNVNNGVILAVEDGAVIHQQLTYSTAAASNAFNAATAMVRIYSADDCYIQFSTSPTATTSTQFLPGGVVDFKFIPKGASFKISAYDGVS